MEIDILRINKKRDKNELLDKSSLREFYKDQIFKVHRRIYVIDYIYNIDAKNHADKPDNKINGGMNIDNTSCYIYMYSSKPLFRLFTYFSG